MICTQDNTVIFDNLDTLKDHVIEQDIRETEPFELRSMQMTPEGALRVDRIGTFALTDVGHFDALTLAHQKGDVWALYEQDCLETELMKTINAFYGKSREMKRGRKLITRLTTPEEREEHGGYERAVISIPSPKYALLRHETAIEAVQNAGDQNELSLKRARLWGNKMDLACTNVAMKAHATDVGDIVEIGASFQNSLDRSLIFGASAFTYRLWCSNGCASIHPEYSVKKKHLEGIMAGDSLNGGFSTGIHEIVQKTQVLLEALPKMNAIPVDEKFLLWLAPRLAPAMKKKYADLYLDNLRETKTSALEVWNQITEMAHTKRLELAGTKQDIEMNVDRCRKMEQVGFDILLRHLKHAS